MLGCCSPMQGLCSQLCKELPVIYPCFAEQTAFDIFVVLGGMSFLRHPRSSGPPHRFPAEEDSRLRQSQLLTSTPNVPPNIIPTKIA